jgi:hypothetical protein
MTWGWISFVPILCKKLWSKGPDRPSSGLARYKGHAFHWSRAGTVLQIRPLVQYRVLLSGAVFPVDSVSCNRHGRRDNHSAIAWPIQSLHRSHRQSLVTVFLVLRHAMQLDHLQQDQLANWRTNGPDINRFRRRCRRVYLDMQIDQARPTGRIDGLGA